MIKYDDDSVSIEGSPIELIAEIELLTNVVILRVSESINMSYIEVYQEIQKGIRFLAEQEVKKNGI